MANAAIVCGANYVELPLLFLIAIRVWFSKINNTEKCIVNSLIMGSKMYYSNCIDRFVISEYLPEFIQF